jgi:hypothetical protein
LVTKRGERVGLLAKWVTDGKKQEKGAEVKWAEGGGFPNLRSLMLLKMSTQVEGLLRLVEGHAVIYCTSQRQQKTLLKYGCDG